MKKLALCLAMITFVSSESRATVNVVSGSATRLESAMILNYSGTISIAQQTGPWISSITRTAQGKVTINISSGVFSDVPNCTCTAKTGINAICSINNSITQTATEVPVLTGYDELTPEDYHFEIICHGPND